MFVEFATTERFADPRRVRGPAALETSDFTSRLDADRSSRPGQRIFYRVLYQDLSDLRTWSEPVAGSFTTPSSTPRDVTIAWSADTVGQGWGINPEWGGLRLYETMRRAQPDVFINVGDTIYADEPLLPEVKLDDGSIWKNVVTEAKSKVAQTLGRLPRLPPVQPHRRAHAALHRRDLADRDVGRPRGARQLVLGAAQGRRPALHGEVRGGARRARRQAFVEYNPLPDLRGRSRAHLPLDSHGPARRGVRAGHADPQGRELREPAAGARRLLGDLRPAQLQWLKASLKASKATWKIVAADLPLGLVVGDGPGVYEAVANGDPGAPLGRELEVADLLADLKRNRVRNVVWITADVHYCAAHHYHPTRAKFTNFDPFWEFVAGPLNAGTFGPGTLDPTFGPEAKFVGIPPGMKANRPPSDGFQFFGTLKASAKTRALTVQLHDLAGKTIYSVDLPFTRA